jgi:hypothetical protein
LLLVVGSEICQRGVAFRSYFIHTRCRSNVGMVSIDVGIGGTVVR